MQYKFKNKQGRKQERKEAKLPKKKVVRLGLKPILYDST